MKNKNLLTAAFILLNGLLTFTPVFAQNGNVGIGTTTPDANAILDLTSTNQGLLMPRLNNSQEMDLTSAQEGMVFYNTDTNTFRYNIGDGLRNVGFWTPSGTTNIVHQGSVGINTLSPTGVFSVKGISGFGVLLNAENASGASIMKISEVGSVSINSTSSGAALNVRGKTGLNTIFSTQNMSGVQALTVSEDRTVGINFGYFYCVFNVRGTGVGTLFNIENSLGVARMRVLDTGEVGIGTVTPAAKLHVAGTGKIEGNVDIGGDITIDNQKPFQIVEFAVTGGTVLNTLVSGSSFNAVLAGFRSEGGDISEFTPGNQQTNLMECYLTVNATTGTWEINADFRTQADSAQETWDVTVMFISKKISTHHLNP